MKARDERGIYERIDKHGRGEVGRRGSQGKGGRPVRVVIILVRRKGAVAIEDILDMSG